VEGRFLRAPDVAGLRREAVRAESDGVDAVFVSEGPLGDPVVLAAGLSDSATAVMIGARVHLADGGRHPAMLARDLTSLDLVSGGRSVLCFRPPFDPAERLAEAIALCRALWHDDDGTTEGTYFRVKAPKNRARPATSSSPLVALDLSASVDAPASLTVLADLVLRADSETGWVRMERP
jgi:alkanesulfonate monooxygenase SsuD/methylene tetrahydromethanopterin reductase-like flavin-dependent oxidoreductase (luciferase family)